MTTEQEKELVDAFIGGLCNPPAESDEADITNLTVDIDHDTARCCFAKFRARQGSRCNGHPVYERKISVRG